MKKLLFILAIVSSVSLSAQYDTLVSISNSPITGLARKAAPINYSWDLLNKVMTLQVTILTYNDSIINNLQIHPYSVVINTIGICVVPTTGQEVPCITAGSIPQYPFLRAESLKQVSIMSEILQYIQIADSNHSFDN